MSSTVEVKTITIRQIRERKGGEPVVCLTAYTTPIAEILDDIVDLILVGDSMSNVILGHSNTLPITLDQMIAHAQAVSRGVKRACLIFDMPFGSYEESPEQAMRNAVRVMKETGCVGVKLEGGRYLAETVSYLTERGVPVMGHVGMLPHYVNQRGFAVRGRTNAESDDILQDAVAIDQAGVFSTVLEAVAEPLARNITETVSNITIGIGASAACDGQIVVTEDILGLTCKTPSFVKRYAELRDVVTAAIKSYDADVRSRLYPTAEHTYAAEGKKKSKS
ncbi:MAG TPA: 3-methyl-2-oxobutanoate hydroxymethyltransferase [Alphaproteobacteria bacterium]|nr:3-methyl-2-oxobutanoate hydroxymethyltransferase [Alphaproteobacteria bacterium]